MTRAIDHLVLAVPDLGEGVEYVEGMFGIRPSAGGRHPGWGTMNALLALGPACYLEVIGPDPQQPEVAGRRLFGVDLLDGPRLVSWAAKGTDLQTLANAVRSAGIDLGTVVEGSRITPDGILLSWKLTDPYQTGAGGLRPFLIDWGTTPHPAGAAASGCTLVGLRAEHPEPKAVKDMLDRLDIVLPITLGASPALIATIDSPLGAVELR
ncbi:MAG: VOC family protein [Proteobacteria bacterium]|nr:VOC family protein [Pseudomonadota bacterium]